MAGILNTLSSLRATAPGGKQAGITEIPDNPGFKTCVSLSQGAAPWQGHEEGSGSHSCYLKEPESPVSGLPFSAASQLCWPAPCTHSLRTLRHPLTQLSPVLQPSPSGPGGPSSSSSPACPPPPPPPSTLGLGSSQVCLSGLLLRLAVTGAGLTPQWVPAGSATHQEALLGSRASSRWKACFNEHRGVPSPPAPCLSPH